MKAKTFAYAVCVLLALIVIVAELNHFIIVAKSKTFAPTNPIEKEPTTYCGYIQPFDPTVEMLARQITINHTGCWDAILEIYDWVDQHITYRAEPNGQDYFQTPRETLGNGTGDCEDFSILLASLILAYCPNTTVFCVIIGTAERFTKCVGHCAVILPAGDEICILDEAGRWLTIDATGKLTTKNAEKEINAWLKMWDEVGLPNAQITCTFSSATEQNYDSNSEFLKWIAATTGGGN